ncbi:transposase, MuDR, MULE transposase domain protein [Tanacetum coccineum]
MRELTVRYKAEKVCHEEMVKMPLVDLKVLEVYTKSKKEYESHLKINLELLKKEKCHVKPNKLRLRVDVRWYRLRRPKQRTRQQRCCEIVAVIKSCTPNALGDLTVTLKDLSGTIFGTIHYKVLTEERFAKAITIGAALILHNVSIFSPKQSTQSIP